MGYNPLIIPKPEWSGDFFGGIPLMNNIFGWPRLGCPGTEVSKWFFHLLTNGGVNWGYKPLILTFY